jgi:short-subunit dehydrogenase involved in D-alanine esterification of teichoic acids
MHSLIVVMRAQLKSVNSNVKIVELFPPAVQTELHDPKYQPEFKGKPAIGWPLDKFTDEAWKGLEEGREQILVGMAEQSWERWEKERQVEFGEWVQMLGDAVRP